MLLIYCVHLLHENDYSDIIFVVKTSVAAS